MLLDSVMVTSNGQITMPRAVRERFGLHEGSRLLFEETPDGELRLRPVGDGAPLDLWLLLQRGVSAEARAEGVTEPELRTTVDRMREEIHCKARRAR